MGLTNAATGRRAVDAGAVIHRRPEETVIALAGNPNVGKSTLFNALTGMHQHTGNWPGKTVSNAVGHCTAKGRIYTLVDIPGTYSLLAHSAEEEVARNFICFGNPDGVAVVCDATALARSLPLVLQILETGAPTLVCVNLLDEAKRKGITVDIAALERRLGVPVAGTVARQKRRLTRLAEAFGHPRRAIEPPVVYPAPIEAAVMALAPLLEPLTKGLSPRWVALRLLEGDAGLLRELAAYLGQELTAHPAVAPALTEAQARLARQGFAGEALRDALVTAIVTTAEKLAAASQPAKGCGYSAVDRRLDRLLTGRLVGYPVMLLLLLMLFWLTIVGANGPSQLLSAALFRVEDWLTALFAALHAPDWLHGAVVEGAYRVLAWVVSVMLPPMAIFFPLFTLLEDSGYLPRIAYNLDKPFHRCQACGKQALTMCMGFGCNAAGVVGCRIIDSPRERLLAILTNSLVPCNGRFPALITLITLFFVGSSHGGSLLSALLLTGVILLGVGATLLMTRLLSATLLKGEPSAFTLELPPYRRPQVRQVLVRSVVDRTVFVLGRAAAVAAPAGLVIWVLANVTVGNATLLAHCAAALQPLGHAIGMDGVILLAFILGFPANEIVLPIALMTYMAQGTLTELQDPGQILTVLAANGWDARTALCVILFSLFHWPCSTTLLTVRKETGSWRWTALAAILPTLLGAGLCVAINALWGLFGG